METFKARVDECIHELEALPGSELTQPEKEALYEDLKNRLEQKVYEFLSYFMIEIYNHLSDVVD